MAGEVGNVNEHPEHDLNALAAYLEGRLEGEEQRRTIEHLSHCLECREMAALVSRSWRTVRAGDGDGVARGWAATAARFPWLGLAAVAVVATVVAVRLRPPPSPVAGPVTSPPAAAASAPGPASPSAEAALRPPSVIQAPSVRARATADPIDESLLARRAGVKRVAGKAFRFVRGEWVDSSFDPTAALAVVEVEGPAERQRIVARLPGLAPYLALGDRVVVVFEGTVYRSRPAEGR